MQNPNSLTGQPSPSPSPPNPTQPNPTSSIPTQLKFPSSNANTTAPLKSSPTGDPIKSNSDIASSNRTSTQDAEIITRQKLQALVAQVSPATKLDSDVEEILMDVADDFIESVTNFACSLAKHRKSSTLEVKDVQLHLERNWNIKVPFNTGVEEEGVKAASKRAIPADIQNRRELVKRAKQAQPNPKKETENK